MSNDEVVPRLELVSPVDEEPLLPGETESGVEVWRGTGSYEAYGYDGRGYGWIQFPGLGVFRFRQSGSVVAIPEPGVSNNRVEDQYLRGALPLVLQMRGHQVLHASAVSTPSGVLALCGVSGAGKSTLAHALSRLGHSPWADDALVFAVSDAGVRALGVPFEARLSGEARLALAVDPRESSVPTAPERRAQPLYAVIVLEPAEDDTAPLTRIDRLAPIEAFTALLPHAYAYRAGEIERNRRLTTAYLALVESVPVYIVQLRRNLADLPAAVDELEARVIR
jgi:hypothetical protein